MAYQPKSYRKYVAAAATATLVATALSPASAASFKDVSSHYKEAVDYLISNHITKGISASKFGTHLPIKRADAAVMIAKALNLNVSDVKASGFKDVPKRAKKYVDALKEADIISGKSSDSFAPDQKITRGEAAIMLSKAYKLQGKSKKSPFKDVTSRYKEAVDALVSAGITKGKGADSFGTNDPIKRGDFAVLLHKLSKVKKPEAPEKDNFMLSLMHTNDTHANLDSAPKKMTAIKEVRAEKPDALLIDAGDVFSGTLYFNEFKGQADLKFMNLMGYDVMTFGNHEFDLGSSKEGHQALADFIEGAKFSFVSANVDFSKDDTFKGLFSDTISSKPEEGKIYNGIVKEVDGEKVGFFGLTTQDTKEISSPKQIEFQDYIKEAEKAVQAFEGMGVNKIVAVSHIGYDDNEAVDNDLTLAAKVDGIDVIVGGHSHTKLDEPVAVNKDENGKGKNQTVIVHADQYNKHLGTLDVEFDKDGKVIGHAGKLIEIKDQAEDVETKDLLKPYAEKIQKIKNEPTGGSAAKLLDNPRTGGDNSKPSVRKNETELGNLITDGMLAKAKEYNPDVVMALQNGGGIRTTVDKGEITVGEVINVLPFGNTLATMEVTGAELKAAFETSVKDLPRENGGFLHVSGAKVQYDSSKPAGERIVSVAYKKADGSYAQIQAEETYTIATNAFTAKGGDGYDIFKKAYEEGRVTDLGLSDWENLRDHIAQLKTVDPKIEGRIVDVAETGTGSYSGSESGGSSQVLTLSPADFSGTPDKPKHFTQDVKVKISQSSSLSNAVIQGDLILTGTANPSITYENIIVKGKLDLSAVEGDTSKLSNIEAEEVIL